MTKLLIILALCALGCAHTKLERWEGGEKVLEVSTLNWFSGDVFSQLQLEDADYSTGAERKGLSANGLKAIESKPISSMATSIGKAVTGTSGIPDIPDITIDRSSNPINPEIPDGEGG